MLIFMEDSLIVPSADDLSAEDYRANGYGCHQSLEEVLAMVCSAKEACPFDSR